MRIKIYHYCMTKSVGGREHVMDGLISFEDIAVTGGYRDLKQNIIEAYMKNIPSEFKGDGGWIIRSLSVIG